jgi:DNA-binding transcriptional regulator of glucitol operon
MKKISLVLVICLCACGQGSSSRISQFNEANGMVGNRPPSGYIEDGDSYWKSRDLAVGKDWVVLQTNGNTVEQAIVGCLFANTGAQTKWLKESYDTLVANKWALLSDDGETWVLMKGDNLASGVSSVDNGTISASVVFMSVSTALGDSTGGTMAYLPD